MLQTKYVLLVEDDIHLVHLLLRAVPPLDPAVQIDHVADGVSALDYIQCQGKFLDRLPIHPRLVLVDLSMPKMDGLEFLRQIKQTENLRAIPVVMLTSSRNEKDILKCYRAGANAYVVKPVDYQEFRTVIGQLLIFWMCMNEAPPAFAPAVAPGLQEPPPRQPMSPDRKSLALSPPPPRDGNGTHKELWILLLEDSPAHVELVERVLRDGGVECAMTRVETEESFRKQLDHFAPDLILSDYALPGFDGLTALGIAKEKAPDVPFIFVTGTMGEELAIETLKNGATDYVLKSRLSRLVPAVQRALRETGERRERKLAEERLLRTNEQLRALSAYLQYVREEERTRIAREVHDELGQNLTGLRLDLSWLTGQLSGKGSRTLRTKVKGLLTQVDATIQTVRRIATELRPSILDDLGLVAAIEWQSNDFQGRTGIQCTVACRAPEILWDHDFTTVFFRIFQETLTNIIRHADATQVAVRLEEEHGALVLEVVDNGRGITENEIANTRSIGLIGMRERAALVGGEVTFRGGPAGGTTVRVQIPIPRAAPGQSQPPQA